MLMPTARQFRYESGVWHPALAPPPFGAGVGTVHSDQSGVPHNMVNF